MCCPRRGSMSIEHWAMKHRNKKTIRMWSLAEKDNIHEAGASYQEEDEHVFVETRQEKFRCSRRTQYCEDMEFLQKERLRDREKMLLWSPSRNEENMWEKLAKTVQDAHINVECLQKARTKQGSVRGWLYCGVLAVAVLLQRWRRRHRCSPVSQWGPGSTRHPLSSSNLFQNVSPNDCSFNSSTGHSLRQDLRFFPSH